MVVRTWHEHIEYTRVWENHLPDWWVSSARCQHAAARYDKTRWPVHRILNNKMGGGPVNQPSFFFRCRDERENPHMDMDLRGTYINTQHSLVCKHCAVLLRDTDQNVKDFEKSLARALIRPKKKVLSPGTHRCARRTLTRNRKKLCSSTV